jgi:hypothetical protein
LSFQEALKVLFNFILKRFVWFPTDYIRHMTLTNFLNMLKT